MRPGDPPVRGPYAAAHEVYLDAGWRGVLPLPPRSKQQPPAGFTGASGAWPTPEKVRSWAANGHGPGNIALRVPGDIVGIDVDQYGTKRGHDAVQALAATQRAAGRELPGLEQTWRSGARPWPSGIYWFRVPPGTILDGAPLPGVEVVQHRHRYAVVWPSVHPEGGVYQWFTPDGEMADRPPGPDDLPDLPPEWVELLSARRAPDRPAANAPAGEHREIVWAPAVTRAHQSAVTALGGGGARHDAALAGSCALARLEQLGTAGATAALDDLGDRFVAAVTTTVTGQRRLDEATREWTDMLDGARTKVQTTASTAGGGPPPSAGPPPTDGRIRHLVTDLPAPPEQPPWYDEDPGPAAVLAPVLPSSFWESRSVLAHIRQAAHNRNRSADLVLHAVLARVCAYSLHSLELPPIVGAPGSLNYDVAATGPSGSGKTSGVAIASELVARPPDVNVADNMPLGSGEGVAELFMGTVEEEREDGKTVKVRRQVRHNAFMFGDEGQALTAMMDRSGATLAATLRTAWTGADLGQANASAERTRIIHAGQYRLAVVVGFQPEVAGALIADASAGTPQRFIWASAIDPNVPDTPPPWPGPLTVPTLAPGQLEAHRVIGVGGYVRCRFGVDPAIVAEVRGDDLARVRGDTIAPELDSHAPLHRLKVAGLLALLDGRLDITLDDWALATTVWATSCRVRAAVVAAVGAQRERVEEAKVDQLARREFAAEAARRSAPAAVERIATLISRWVHRHADDGNLPDDGMAWRDVHNSVASRDRRLLDPAISHAVEQGWLSESGGRYHPGLSRPA